MFVSSAHLSFYLVTANGDVVVVTDNDTAIVVVVVAVAVVLTTTDLFPPTESKIDALTSPARLKSRVGKDVVLWCNATGYPKPMVYWTREDRNRKLPDGSYQHWVGHWDSNVRYSG